MKLRLTVEVPEVNSAEEFVDKFGDGFAPLSYHLKVDDDTRPSLSDLSEEMQEAEDFYGPPEGEVQRAVAVYLSAKSMIEQYEEIQKRAKKVLSDVIEETGKSSWSTNSGNVAMSAGSVSVSYDASALDILMRDDPDLAMRLGQYRKEVARSGSMRITKAK